MPPKQWVKVWTQIRDHRNSVWRPTSHWLCPQPHLKLGLPVDEKAVSQFSSKFSLSYTQPNTSPSEGYTLFPVTQASGPASSLISLLLISRICFARHSHPSLPPWSYCYHISRHLYNERKNKQTKSKKMYKGI